MGCDESGERIFWRRHHGSLSYIRYCILESGFGWLPFWARVDDQSIHMSYALPENLAHKPSEYMTSGRFFASLVIHEGEKMAGMVATSWATGC